MTVAITFDNASTAAGVAVTSITWTHTAGGTNTYLLVGGATSGANPISAVAANGNSLTMRAAGGQGTNSRGSIWDVSGLSGVLSISAIPAAGATTSFGIGAVSYAGVAQTNPAGGGSSLTAVGAIAFNFSVSATANNVCVAVWTTNSITAAVVTAPQTERFRAGTTAFIICAEKSATGAVASFSWTCATGKSVFMAGIPISGTDSVAGAASFIVGIPLIGVGQ